MKTKLLTAVLAASFALSGCAAMFNGTTDQLTINSRTKGAEIYVNGQFVGTGSVVYEAPKKGNQTSCC